jgi:hypothetical protein
MKGRGVPMSLHEVEAVLSRITYKPGWTLKAWNDQGSFDMLLRITMPVPCRDTGKPIMVTQIRAIYPFEDERRLIQFVRCCLHDLEIHEADEMLLVDGVRMFDPHQ